MKNLELPHVLKTLRDAVVNTPALDSSKDWTELVELADKALARDQRQSVVSRSTILDLLRKCLSWSECYAKAHSIDSWSGAGPLSQDIRAARAVFASIEHPPSAEELAAFDAKDRRGVFGGSST